MPANAHPTCTLVVPVYNEEAGIELFYKTILNEIANLNADFEIIFVNDGSTDRSKEILKEITSNDTRVKIISFSRNYGHESAMIAGIDYSSGDAVICLDSDLQHPPKEIGKMLEKFNEGYEVVNMVRTKNGDQNARESFNSRFFYRLINRISDIKLTENASDFFLISRRVAEILKSDFRERTRFLRGIIQMVGFRRTTLEYEAAKRTAGESKYSFWKLMKLSFTAIASFSKIPLLLGIVSGVVFGIISIILIIYSLIMWIFATPVSGYTTLIIFLCAFASIQLFVTGLIGQYIGYLFDEIKGRPIYLVEEITDNNPNEK